MKEKKLKGQTASIVEFVFGALFALGGVGIIGTSPLQGLGYIAFGAFLILTGIQWRMLIKEYRAYMTILSNDPTGSIASISQATNASNSTAKENLKLMIKKGLAKDLVIDEQGGRILRNQEATTVPAPTTAPVVPAEKVTVTCTGCGAKSEITKGTTQECDHCGASIQG